MNTDSRKTGYVDFLLIDLFAIAVSFVVSYLIKFGDLGFISSSAWAPLFFIVCLVCVVICLFSDPYSGIFRRPYYEEILKSVLLTVYNLLASSVIFYVFKIGPVFSRQMILQMYAIFFVLSPLLRCIWKKLILARIIRVHSAKKTPLIVAGRKADMPQILHNAAASDFDSYEFCGILLTDDRAAEEFDGIKTVPGWDALNDFAAAGGAEEVLIAVSLDEVPSEVTQALVRSGIAVHMSIDSLLGFTAEDNVIGSVGVYNTLSVGTYSFSLGQKLYLILKRAIDILCGILGVLLLVPVSAAVKLACLASGDRAKIFYRQKRLGRNGKEINIYKFRTMVPDADKRLEELLKNEKLKAQWDANQKLDDDPRITKAGSFLRRTSLDELPQLINVLCGDMSLVGPRPLVPGELEAHGGMKFYQMVRPGITGWWGCNGRSNIDYHERLELEYYYIRNFSIYMDFLCVLRTVFSVLKRDGAK